MIKIPNNYPNPNCKSCIGTGKISLQYNQYEVCDCIFELRFKEWPKISRLNREIVITEKIDGTNAAIVIGNNGEIAAQSRNQMLIDKDNAGFKAWVMANQNFLIETLGPGHHFGEWWGKGIQRGYNQQTKIFSLFNVDRWSALSESDGNLRRVPILGMYNTFDSNIINGWITELKLYGSKASPGFMNPEGIVVFHTASNLCYKVTCKNDEKPKGMV